MAIYGYTSGAMKTTRERLEHALQRINRAARELRLHPETFEATVLLDLTAGDLAIVLEELFPAEDDEEEVRELRRTGFLPFSQLFHRPPVRQCWRLAFPLIA